MKTYEELAEAIGNGSVIVMPDEDSVRSLLEYSVRKNRHAVRMDRVIAFDRLWDSCFPERKNLRPVNADLRRIFVRNLVERDSDKLRYFIPADSDDDFKYSMISYLVKMLPSLEEALSLDGGAFRHDVEFLYSAYCCFLEENNLYESAFIHKGLRKKSEEGSDAMEFIDAECQLPSSDIYKFSLYEFSPVLKKRFEWLLGKFGKDVIQSLSNVPALQPNTELKVYENERQEIRHTFLQIAKELKDQGGKCRSDQIAITVPSIDTLRPYLEKESYLFDIPLCFKDGRTFDSTPAYRFISNLVDLCKYEWETIKTRDFVLDPSFPIAGKEELGKIVYSKINCSCRNMSGTDMDLFTVAEKLYSLDEPNELTEVIDIIQNEILEKDSEETPWPEAFRESWKELLRMASQFVHELSALAYDTIVFSIEDFLESIKGRRVGDGTQGISVYSWPSSSCIHYKKKYILSLSEDRARIKWKSASFLDDYEKTSDDKFIDFTADAVACAIATSDECILSVSKDTYEGSTLPLSIFSNFNEVENPDFSKDPYQMIYKGYKDLPRMSVIKKGHENRILPRLDSELDAFSNHHMPEDHVYSYSQIDQYSKCHYKYILNRVFGLDKVSEHDIEDNFATEIGTRIHKVIEIIFNEIKSDDEISIETWKTGLDGMVEDLLGKQLDAWRQRISAEGKLLRPDVPDLTPEMESYIWKNYKKGIVYAINECLKPGHTYENELELHETLDGLKFVSYIDMLDIDRQGNVVTIFDWKTGKNVGSTLQFNVYRKMLQEKGKFEGAEYKAWYGYILSSKLHEPDLNRSYKGETKDEKLTRNISSLKSRDWNPIKSSKCADCEFKDICRINYNGEDEDEE